MEKEPLISIIVNNISFKVISDDLKDDFDFPSYVLDRLNYRDKFFDSEWKENLLYLLRHHYGEFKASDLFVILDKANIESFELNRFYLSYYAKLSQKDKAQDNTIFKLVENVLSCEKFYQDLGWKLYPDYLELIRDPRGFSIFNILFKHEVESLVRRGFPYGCQPKEGQLYQEEYQKELTLIGSFFEKLPLSQKREQLLKLKEPIEKVFYKSYEITRDAVLIYLLRSNVLSMTELKDVLLSCLKVKALWPDVFSLYAYWNKNNFSAGFEKELFDQCKEASNLSRESIIEIQNLFLNHDSCFPHINKETGFSDLLTECRLGATYIERITDDSFPLSSYTEDYLVNLLNEDRGTSYEAIFKEIDSRGNSQLLERALNELLKKDNQEGLGFYLIRYQAKIGEDKLEKLLTLCKDNLKVLNTLMRSIPARLIKHHSDIYQLIADADFSIEPLTPENFFNWNYFSISEYVVKHIEDFAGENLSHFFSFPSNRLMLLRLKEPPFGKQVKKYISYQDVLVSPQQFNPLAISLFREHSTFNDPDLYQYIFNNLKFEKEKLLIVDNGSEQVFFSLLCQYDVITMKDNRSIVLLPYLSPYDYLELLQKTENNNPDYFYAVLDAILNNVSLAQCCLDDLFNYLHSNWDRFSNRVSQKIIKVLRKLALQDSISTEKQICFGFETDRTNKAVAVSILKKAFKPGWYGDNKSLQRILDECKYVENDNKYSNIQTYYEAIKDRVRG